MKQKHSQLHVRLAAFLVVLASSIAGSLQAGVEDLGISFRPDGANFTINAVQAVNPNTGTVQNGVEPHVNRNFEFDQAIGVSWDQGGGNRKDFGLGLYSDPQGQVQSTGVHIVYDQAVSLSSITITVEDFDIKTGKDTFFNPKKVEPGILFFGTDNKLLFSALPTDIFDVMTPHANPPGSPNAKDDTWDINFGNLITKLNKQDGLISGFILYADATAGEKPNSDPYLLISIGNGITPIPEPENYLAGLAAIAFAVVFHLRRVLAKRAKMQ